MSENPLVANHTLPPFSQITPDHVLPMVKAFTQQHAEALEKQLTGLEQPCWETLVAPMEERDDILSKAWSPVGHLNLVRNNEALRKEYEQALPILSNYHTALGQNKALADAYTALAESTAFDELNQAQKKAVENALRDFKLSGIDLPEDKKKRYADIQAQLSKLSNAFSNNVLDSAEAWHFYTDDVSALSGLPDTVIVAAKRHAEQQEDTEKHAGWLLKLDGPSYVAVLTFADSAALREAFYEAYNTRASDQGPHDAQWDNTGNIEEILALRQELAALLGFKHYAELSLETKMASTPEEVERFLLDLAEKAKPKAERDLHELKDWVKRECDINELSPWDIGYYSEKLRQEKYSVSQEEIRQYFTLPKVLNGLFGVVNQLFGIDVTERQGVDLWHQDARFFDICREGVHIASFYIDLYARDGKRGGAWMDVCRTRRKNAGGIQLPVAYLVCNFSAPTGEQPALLSHNDVTTLFHEFGHGLHHMLTQMDVAAVSGISGVEWDAVELPSQFLENWAWQPEVLKEISEHIDSKEALPDALIEKMLRAKHFQSGMFLVRQIEFGLFDMRIHSAFGSESFEGVQASLDEVRRDIAVITPPAYNRFQHGFSHIFAGGYAAGYFSYLWAEVLSADAFSAFEETALFDPETGQRFLDAILSQGGSRSAAELFKQFRGREPSVDALLRHSGIEN